MSLRYEQEASLLMTREFLLDLLNTTTRPKTVKELKELTKKRNLKTPHGAGRKELTEALRKTDVPVQTTVEGAPPLVEGALLEEEDAELTS